MTFLSGYRLLDLAPLGPGPFCARILGDLGFDVIQVREVGAAGPRGRRGLDVPMVFHERAGKLRYAGTPNARSVALDLKADAGREVFRRLVEKADALQEGFRPGVADRLGVGYQAVRAVRPDIVYASISGYGRTGPYRDRPGHDVNYLAVSGFLDLNGRAGGPPAIPATVIADYAAGGMSAAVHILGALLRRERSGEGAYADVSITDAAFALNGYVLDEYLASGIAPRRGETLTSGFWPWYDVYETQDGKFVSLGVIEPRFYEALCRALGRGDLIGEQWSLERREKTRAEFRELFRRRTRDEWAALFAGVDTCFAPVNSLPEALDDPQLRARGMVREIDHPVHGRLRVAGSMLGFEGADVERRRWVTAAGQDTREILGEQGYSAQEIEELRARGVVGLPELEPGG